MSRIRLILIPPSAAMPASCLTLDAQGTVLTRGVVELGGVLVFGGQTVVGRDKPAAGQRGKLGTDRIVAFKAADDEAAAMKV